MNEQPDNALASQVRTIFLQELELEVADSDTDLIETGVLDSITFVQLLVALEERFGVEVDVADLELDDFSSLHRIGRYLARRGANVVALS